MIKSLELGQELVLRNITTLREGKTPPFYCRMIFSEEEVA